MARKKPEVWVCPHNDEVDCSKKKCESCGWNPDVSKARLMAMPGKKFTIPFKGYCEVWAENPEDAEEKAANDEMFFAHYEFGEPTCEEDENELD